MTDDDPIDPDRLRRAQERIDAAGSGPPPYPSREATDFDDGALLYAYELMNDPQWVARNWLPPDPPATGDPDDE